MEIYWSQYLEYYQNHLGWFSYRRLFQGHFRLIEEANWNVELAGDIDVDDIVMLVTL